MIAGTAGMVVVPVRPIGSAGTAGVVPEGVDDTNVITPTSFNLAIVLGPTWPKPVVLGFPSVTIP